MFDKNPHSQIKAKREAAKGNTGWHTKPARLGGGGGGGVQGGCEGAAPPDGRLRK